MYRVEEYCKLMTIEEFENVCLEKALWEASILPEMDYEPYIIFRDQVVKPSGNIHSKICVREMKTSLYKTIHIVKHIYQVKDHMFFQEDVMLSENQIECIINMDTILEEKKKKPTLKVIK